MKLTYQLLVLAFLTLSLESIAQFEVKIRGGDVTLCENESLVLSDSVVSGVPESYEWISSVATFNTAYLSSTAVNITQSGIIILKTKDASNTFLDTINVTVNSLPEIILIGLTPSQYCETASDIALNASPSGGTWTSEDPTALVNGNTFSPSNASIFDQNTKLFYNYTNPTTGCSNLDSMEVRVDPKPVLDPISDTTFCRKQGVMTQNISRLVTGQNYGMLGWAVFNPRVTLSDVAIGNITLNLQNNQPDTFTIVIAATELASCEPIDGYFKIIVNPIPDASITNSNPSGCNPVTSDFSIDITNSVESSTSTYNWTMGDAGSSTATTSTSSATYNEDGSASISVVLTSAVGCDTTLTSTVDVYPIPTAGFVPNPDNFTTTALPRFIFTSTSTVDPVLGASIVQYEWDFGDLNDDQDISNEENPPFFYPTDTNSYIVNLRVTTNHGCSDDFSYPVIVGPSISSSISHVIFPNPTSGSFRVTDYTPSMSLEVIDNKGTQIDKLEVSEDGQFTIEGRGHYIIRIFDSETGDSFCSKILVE
ncbi:MAG: hypothetical protein COA58_00790 [Bacteroidetes bacterium]|nr:MAG: hypothetical protein COA58_00790 [Bacteroidota bacterium]